MINIGIIGASGFTGINLLKILLKHKFSKVNLIVSKSFAGKKLIEIDDHFLNSKFSDLEFLN